MVRYGSDNAPDNIAMMHVGAYQRVINHFSIWSGKVELSVNKMLMDFDIFEWTVSIRLRIFNLESSLTPRKTRSSCSRICSVQKNKILFVLIYWFLKTIEKVV